MRTINYLLVAFGLIVWNHTAIRAQAKGVLTDELTAWTQDPELASSTVGFYAVDLKSGSTLEDWNGGKAMIPASLMKIATTVAALEELGVNKTFDTELGHTGFIEDGVLYGDLVLRGSGDPTFGSTRLGERPDWLIARFAEAVKRMGIRSISGDFRIDRSAFSPAVPGTWSWEDLTNYYAAIPQPVNFLENQFSLVFSTGVAGTDARLISVSPEIPGLKVVNEVSAGNVVGDQTFCFGHPFGQQIVVRGMLPQNRRTFTVKAAIPDPARFFAEKVMQAADKLGVEWVGDFKDDARGPIPAQDSTTLIFRYTSPTVADIIAKTNHGSINFFAEALLVAMGDTAGYLGGVEALDNFWQQQLTNLMQGARFEDGSGLSHYNALSPAQLVGMLQYAHNRPYREAFEASLPEAGKGTLRGFSDRKLLMERMRAKSGFMTGHRGYAGYMTTAKGRKVAFALMVNHYDITAGAMREKMEQLLEQLALAE